MRVFWGKHLGGGWGVGSSFRVGGRRGGGGSGCGLLLLLFLIWWLVRANGCA